MLNYKYIKCLHLYFPMEADHRKKSRPGSKQLRIFVGRITQQNITVQCYHLVNFYVKNLFVLAVSHSL